MVDALAKIVQRMPTQLDFKPQWLSVVFSSGSTVRAVLDVYISNGRLSVLADSDLDVPLSLVRIPSSPTFNSASGIVFLLVTGDHPSRHMMCGGSLGSVAVIKKQLQVVRAIASDQLAEARRALGHTQTPEAMDIFSSVVQRSLDYDVDLINENKRLVVAFLYGGVLQIDPRGRSTDITFSKKHMHLRMWACHSPEFRDRWNALCTQIPRACLLGLLESNSFALRALDPNFLQHSTTWQAKLSADQFVRVLSSGAASRLMRPEIQLVLDLWFQKFTPDQFVSLASTGSLMSRIEDPVFRAVLPDWTKVFEAKDAVSLMTTSSLMKRIEDPAYRDRVNYFCDGLCDRDPTTERLDCTLFLSFINGPNPVSDASYPVSHCRRPHRCRLPQSCSKDSM